MRASRRVVITGLGVVSPIGIGKDAFWENLIAGKSGVDYITAFLACFDNSRWAPFGTRLEWTKVYL
jgi:3-oxoacyl-(acyl-carrier-protein) synthase